MTFPACAASASRMTFGEWPREFTAQPWMKSRYLRPSLSYSQEPSPRTNVTSGRVVINISESVDCIVSADCIVASAEKEKAPDLAVRGFWVTWMLLGLHTASHGRMASSRITTYVASRIACFCCPEGGQKVHGRSLPRKFRRAHQKLVNGPRALPP